MAVSTGVSTGIGGSVEIGWSGAWVRAGVFVGDDVAVDCGVSVGAMVAAWVTDGWGGWMAVGVATPVDAQPASIRQIVMMVMGVILCVLMPQAS